MPIFLITMSITVMVIYVVNYAIMKKKRIYIKIVGLVISGACLIFLSLIFLMIRGDIGFKDQTVVQEYFSTDGNYMVRIKEYNGRLLDGKRKVYYSKSYYLNCGIIKAVPKNEESTFEKYEPNDEIKIN